MSGKRPVSFEQRRPRRIAISLLVLLIIGGGLWWGCSALMHWGLQRLLDQTSLSLPKFSGLRLGLHQGRLDEIEFGADTGAGILTAQLQGVTADYDLGVPGVQAIHVNHARLKFAYRPVDKPETEASTRGLPFPLQRLNIGQLDLEVDTPWGLSSFTGQTEIGRGEAHTLEARFQDSKQAIRLELGSDLRTAKASVEQIPSGKVFELNAHRLEQGKLQAGLDANVSPLLEWLTASELVPETLRAKMAISDAPKLRPGLASMKLTAAAHGHFGNAEARLILTRDEGYLASADMKLVGGTADIDGHLEMSATDAFEFIRPWLPATASGWQFSTGNLQGTIKLRWQPQQNIAGKAHLKAYDLGLTAGVVRIADGYFDLNIEDIARRSLALSLAVPKLELSKETTLHDLTIAAGLLDRELTLERVTLPMFGGLLEILPDTVNIDQRPIHLTLGVRNVDLSQLLNSLNYPALSGTGSISGKLPLRIESDTVEVEGGTLTGTRPGMLHYQGPVADDENIAFKALRNLAYHSLQGRVNYRPNGDYQLGLRLEGSNPEVLSGHPLAFNLNLNGQLPGLLKNGILPGNFEQSILEQATTKPANNQNPAKPLPSPR